MADWYAAWVDHHTTAFGIGDPRVLAAFSAWHDALTVSLEASEVQLYEATRRALLDTPTPRWPNDHLDSLKRHLAAVKADNVRAVEKAASDRFGECIDCGNTGVVVVPHPQHVSLGEWQPWRFTADGTPVRATAGVYCNCQYGQRTYQNACVRAEDRGRDRPLDLGGYERKVTRHWRTLLAAEGQRRAILGHARELGEAARAEVKALPARVAGGPRD